MATPKDNSHTEKEKTSESSAVFKDGDRSYGVAQIDGNSYLFMVPERLTTSNRWDASQRVISCLATPSSSPNISLSTVIGITHGDKSEAGDEWLEKYKHLIGDRSKIFGTPIWPLAGLPPYESVESLFREFQENHKGSAGDEINEASLRDDKERLADLAEAASSDTPTHDALAQSSIDVRRDTVAILGGPAVLGRTILCDEDVVEAVSAGFPADVLSALRESGLPPSAIEQVIAPKRTLMRRKANKQRLTRPESDSAWRIAGSYGLACRVLNGKKSAISWLSRPKDILQGRTAFDLIETSVGTAYVQRLLRQLDWGDVA